MLFNYPGCSDSYISKTEHKLYTKTGEYTCSDKENVNYNHITAIFKIYSASKIIHLIKH